MSVNNTVGYGNYANSAFLRIGTGYPRATENVYIEGNSSILKAKFYDISVKSISVSRYLKTF